MGVNAWAIEANSWPEVEGTITKASLGHEVCGSRTCSDYCLFSIAYTPTAPNGAIGSKTYTVREPSYRVGDKGEDCDLGRDHIMIRYDPDDPSNAEASDSLDTRMKSIIAAWVMYGVGGTALAVCCYYSVLLRERKINLTL